MQEINHRLFLASFEYGQHVRATGFILCTDDGHEIPMPFEQQDFIQSQHAQLFELGPVNFVRDVARQHATQNVIAHIMFADDIADRAVDQLQQEKLGQGRRAMSFGVIPLSLLSRRGFAMHAAIAFCLQFKKDLAIEDR